MGIFKLFGDIAESLETASDLSDVMFDVKYAKEKREREKMAKKLHDFKSVDEVPMNAPLLNEMIKMYREEGDAKRAFLCAEKLARVAGYANKVATYYMEGYGTEKNEELALQYLTKYFVEVFSQYSAVRRMDDAWQNKTGFVHPEAQRAAAEILINEKKRSFGLFVLEDALLALSHNVPVMATAEQITEIYSKISDNPYAKYRLWLAGGKKDEQLLQEALDGGCYFATDHITSLDLNKQLREEAQLAVDEGYEYVLNKLNAKINKTNEAYFLFTEGVKEFEKGENSLDNPALAKIDEAARLGHQQAVLWSAQKKSQLGDSAGEAAMAQIYLEGLYGVEQDIDRGVLLLMRASGKGNKDGQYRWAQVLEKGLYNVPADEDQAILLYTKAAKQGHLNACISLAQWYSQPQRVDVNAVHIWLSPVLNLDDSTEENKALRREALLTLVKMYSGYGYHISVFDGLEDAFDYAFEIAEIDLAETKDEYIRKVIGSKESTKYNAMDTHRLSNYYYFKFKEDEQYDTFAVYQALVLWYIFLKENMASHGDIDSMIGLYDEYRSVGTYTIKQYTSSRSIYFSGNKEKSIYWLEKAVAAGDVTAIRTKGEDWKYLGLTESEGTMWLQKARSMGDEIAADTLRIDAMAKKKQAEFEKNVREYLQSQQEYSEQQRVAAKNEKENIESFATVQDMPSVITGPYLNTYRLHTISAFSAEYINDYGEIVVIENRDISAFGNSAKNTYGYFYW